MNHSPPSPVRFAGLRSLLIVVGGPAALDRAARSAADALVLDAGDAPARVRAWLDRARRLVPARPLLVRVAGPGSPGVEAALDAIMPGRPDAVVLPECHAGADVQQLGVKLAVREAELGLKVGATAILAEPSAAGLLALASFTGASARLVGLIAPAVEADPGPPSRAGHPADLLAHALVLLGARAAGLAAFDTDTDVASDAAAVETASRRARGSGFAGRVTRDAARVETINAALHR